MKFTRGMKRDTAHVNQIQDSYRRARNMILDHTTFSVRTEGALDELGSKGDYDLNTLTDYDLCGMIPLPTDRHLAIIRKSDNSHDYLIISDDTYGLITTTAAGEFNWSPNSPIKGVGYENGREDTMVVWTDGVNPAVYMNIDDPTYPILPLFPEVEFPNVRSLPVANQDVGTIDVGAYTFFIAYEIDQNNITPYSPSYGAFKVGYGTKDRTFNTSVGLQFEGLDTSYDYYRIYCIRDFNNAQTAFYVGRQITSNPEFVWTGNKFPDLVATQDLVIPKGWYNTVETLTVSDDRLHIANLSRTDGFDPTTWVANIKLHWSIDGRNKHVNSPMLDNFRAQNWGDSYRPFNDTELEAYTIPGKRDHYGMSMGFMPGCSYAFYIAFLLKDGSWTPGYHIPAQNNNSNSAVDEFDPTIIDTSLLGDAFPTMVPSSTYVDNEFYCGLLGSKSNGNGSFLHVMPSVQQISEAWSDSFFQSQWTGDSQYNPYNQYMWAPTTVGVTARNVSIPADVQDVIQGYSLFYAKPNANTRDVLAYVPSLTSDGFDGTDDGTQDYYVCYDNYLMNTQPSLETKETERVYEGSLWTGSGSGTNPYATTTLLKDVIEFEYLPGNVNGNIFNNRHRENRLCLNLTGVTEGYAHGSSVRGQGDEGSNLLFGQDGFGPYGGGEQLEYQSGQEEAIKDMEFSAVIDTAPPDHYFNIDTQELIQCSYIQKDVSINYMSRVSYGGDCTIAPNRYRRFRKYLNNNNNPLPTTGVDQEVTDVHYLAPEVRAYFTYTYALQHLEDLTDPLLLTNDQILLYEPGGSGEDYEGSPEIMNLHDYPDHSYKKNEFKKAFPIGINEPVYRFKNRIARSNKQNYESLEFQWRNFPALDYYDNALNKGAIVNIESYVGELIIHHIDGIFKTRGKETLETSADVVFVGSGDIFRTAPYELIPTEEGFAGLRQHTDAMLCKAGYCFIDSNSGRVFLLSEQLKEISREGMRLFFKDDFTVNVTGFYSPFINKGYALGFDPVYDRIIITALDGVTNDVLDYKTISYSVIGSCWASMHSYGMQAYGTNKNNFIGFDSALFHRINIGDNTDGAYIECVFNEGGTTSKVFQSFQWNTRVSEGEGLWQAATFDKAIVYNDRGCSNEVDLNNNIRWVEESWNFNDFRNMIADDQQNQPIFIDDELNVAIFNMNKPWYQQQRIRGGYGAIRLIVSSGRNLTLYLNEALARFRISQR